MLDRSASVPDPAPAAPEAERPSPNATAPPTAEGECPDADRHPVPVVRVQTDDSGDVRFEETGTVHWLSASFLDHEYGVDPHRLCELRISGLSLGDTVRPGDRVLVEAGDDLLSDGSVCLIHGPLGVVIRRVGLRGETVVLRADGTDTPDQSVRREAWAEKYHPFARILEVRHPL